MERTHLFGTCVCLMWIYTLIKPYSVYSSLQMWDVGRSLGTSQQTSPAHKLPKVFHSVRLVKRPNASTGNECVEKFTCTPVGVCGVGIVKKEFGKGSWQYSGTRGSQGPLGAIFLTIASRERNNNAAGPLHSFCRRDISVPRSLLFLRKPAAVVSCADGLGTRRKFFKGCRRSTTKKLVKANR